MAASVGWKVKDAIVGFHGIGRLEMRPARVGGEHLVIHTDRAEGPAQTHQRIEVEKFN
jgi:hypothetical protein